ncbi:MAG TPA: DegV family protein [Erysipelothrix sp.]|nr:DegV family protein [Erysipelothrix sp.]
MNIALVTDSSADILSHEEETLNVVVVRDPIQIDGIDYLEEVDITLQQITDALNAGKEAKTAMPRTGDIIETFDRLLDQGFDHIIYIPIMESLAGAYSNGMNIANMDEYLHKVTVINAKSVSAPLYFVLKDIQVLIKQGKSPLEIKEKVEQQSTIDAVLLPATLSFLAKGGRINPTIATLGNMIKIIPLLAVSQQGISLEEKKRTLRKAIPYAVETVIKRNQPASDYHWVIVYGDVEQPLKDDMRAAMVEHLGPNVEIETRKLGSVIMCHTGPQSIAIACSKKLA